MPNLLSVYVCMVPAGGILCLCLHVTYCTYVHGTSLVYVYIWTFINMIRAGGILGLYQCYINITLAGGILDLYIFLGPTPEQVVEQYTEVL